MDDSSPMVNLSHPKQDVHKERIRRPGLTRFRVASELVPAMSTAATWLEVGGGTAEFAERLQEKGHQVTLVDLNPQNVEFARGLGFHAIQLDLNEGLKPIPSESFEGASMLDVIEHVVASEQLLLEVRRILKPGGYLILSTPNVAWLPERLRILRGKPPSEEGYHYRFFTTKSMRDLLRQARFEILAQRYSAPAIGLNFLRRKILHTGRRHFDWTGPGGSLLAQTAYFLSRRPLTD